MSLLREAPGFDDPVGLLAACHGRIEDQCAMLVRLPAHLQVNGPDEAARRAGERALRYFETAGRHHHADEDEDLFPLLLRRAEVAGESALARLIGELGDQHLELERLWLGLRPLLERIRDGDAVDPDDLPVETFARVYRRHLSREDEQVLPYARRVLSGDERRVLGECMARRRGAVPSGAPRPLRG